MLALVLSLLGLLELPPPAPPPPEQAAWQNVKTVDGVHLRRAPSGRAAPWGLAEGEIAAPLGRIVAHLTDFPGLVHHVPRLAEVRAGTAVTWQPASTRQRRMFFFAPKSMATTDSGRPAGRGESPNGALHSPRRSANS